MIVFFQLVDSWLCFENRACSDLCYIQDARCKMDHYHYKAFFETILNNSRNDGETSLHPQGWYKDFDLPALLTANVVDKTHNDYKELTETQIRGIAAMKNLALQFTGVNSIRCSSPQFTAVPYWQVVDRHARRCPSRCTSTTHRSSC